MFEVSRLAQAIEEFSSIFYSVCAEQEWEQDEDSRLPELMVENCDALIETLLAMVQGGTSEPKEEIAERA